MAKGFKDSKGKFRPTGSKGVSSREKSIQAVGMSLQKLDDSDDITTEQIELLDELQAIQTDIVNNFDDILFKTSLSKGCDIKDGKLIRTKLTEETPALLPEGTQIEEFCGAITGELTKFIIENYGEGFACEEKGVYVGDDKENSAGFNKLDGQVQHEWIRLADGTIVDASAGQFVEDKDSITNEDRLRIITPDDPRQDWYSPNSGAHAKMCTLCGGRLISGKCDSPMADAIMKLHKEEGLTIEQARQRLEESEEDFAHRLEEERMIG